MEFEFDLVVLDSCGFCAICKLHASSVVRTSSMTWY